MTDWTPEEDEAFNEVERHSNLGKQILRDIEGQPYHYESVFVSASQRNQVLEECAEVCKKHADVYASLEQNPNIQAAWAACVDIRDAIGALKQ
jgi:hypothetical protein